MAQQKSIKLDESNKYNLILIAKQEIINGCPNSRELSKILNIDEFDVQEMIVPTLEKEGLIKGSKKYCQSFLRSKYHASKSMSYRDWPTYLYFFQDRVPKRD